MRKSGRFANSCRIGLIAALALPLATVPARADQPVADGTYGTPPAGWVWQGVWQDGRWSGQWIPTASAQGNTPGYLPPQPPAAPDPETRRMVDRCRNYGHDSGATGGVIGGLAGGVIGNQAVGGVGGTLGGAAVGAVAGAAIDHAGKKARDRDCDAFFAAHPEYAPGARQPTGYGAPPYGAPAYGYAPAGYAYVPGGYSYPAPAGYMMVPAPAQPGGGCTTTTVTTTEYVDAPRHRLIRAKPHRKEKRVYTGS